MLEKKFFEKKTKNFGKLNYNTKIFTTKVYSNIDKCHTIFALLVSFDKNRAKDRQTGSNKNVCGICTRH